MSSELESQVKNWLVGEAEDLLDKAREKDERGFWSQTSQLRNMLQITQTESEVPVLTNFIRYQTGRRATRNFWTLIQEDVIRVLGEIDQRFPGNEKLAVRRLAIQSFFGFLVRYYVYLNELRPPARKAAGSRDQRAGAARA